METREIDALMPKIRQMLADGISNALVSKVTGVNRETIRRRMQAEEDGRVIVRHGPKIDEDALRALVAEGLGLAAISKRLGCSESRAKYRAVVLGLHVRRAGARE